MSVQRWPAGDTFSEYENCYVAVLMSLITSCGILRIADEGFRAAAWDIFSKCRYKHHDNLVPVTTAWRVFRLRMEERPAIWRVAANIFRRRWEDNIKVDL